jgi:hypothetical protein
MYVRGKTWLPTAREMGMGQATICPSLNQLMGCPVPDSCCNPAIGSTFDSSGTQSCYNTSTGATVPCPIAGASISGSPSSQGPFGQMNVSNLNWGILAAVIAGLVTFAALSGGGK